MAPERYNMLSSFLSTIAALAANKKVVGGWLLLLTLATAQVGEKVYVGRTEEMTALKAKVEAIQDSLDRIDSTLNRNSEKLDALLRETVQVKAELEAHRTQGQKK